MGWIIWPIIFFGMMRIFREGGRARSHHRFTGRGVRWGGWGREERSAFEAGPDPASLMRELDDQRAQMAEMATRLSELENRADFAERLLSSPRGKSDIAGAPPGLRDSAG